MANDKLLSIYLNDHLAGATAGRDLARRSLGANKGSQFEDFLRELAGEIEEDRDALMQIMAQLGYGQDRPKQVAAWLGEKLGRLKLNGSWLEYSPLSRVVELEVLSLGVEGKLAAWRALEQVAVTDSRLADADLSTLIQRAKRQREQLERHRRRAVELAMV